jgi:hypothetical protein
MTTNWFESRTRKVLVGYLWGSLIFMGALLVFTFGMGIWAIATA